MADSTLKDFTAVNEAKLVRDALVWLTLNNQRVEKFQWKEGERPHIWISPGSPDWEEESQGEWRKLNRFNCLIFWRVEG